MLILSSGPTDLINKQEIVSLDLFGELVYEYGDAEYCQL